jgi:tRNA G10  N-methylase Trm11
MEKREKDSIHAIVTDPPYGLKEYTTVARSSASSRPCGGGDRPKNAHGEFAEVTVMPRSG